MLRGVVLFCGLYDMSTVGGTGFPALRTYLWAYTGVRDWTSYPAISQLSRPGRSPRRYPPTFLTVGDADPFRFQAAELASALRRDAVPVTTLFWNGTGDHLGHEYQFNFTLPQAAPPSSGRSASWPRSREAEPMPERAAAQLPAATSPAAASPGSTTGAGLGQPGGLVDRMGSARGGQLERDVRRARLRRTVSGRGIDRRGRTPAPLTVGC